MSRPIMPPLARLTRAIGSPVEKWTTSSTSMLVYGWPQRRTGRWIMTVSGLWSQVSGLGLWALGSGLTKDQRLKTRDAAQYTPTVVVAARPRKGRTPLTPSHG